MLVNGAGDRHTDGSGQGQTAGRMLFGALHGNHEIIEFNRHANRHAIFPKSIGFAPIKGGAVKRTARATTKTWIIQHKRFIPNTRIPIAVPGGLIVNDGSAL
jgi:hypothetical protein